MARAARTASVIVVLLGALALVPSIAGAAVSGATSVSFPSEVTLGQTGLTASITLTNQNTASDAGSANTVCNASDGVPCSGTGIELLPSCGGLSGLGACDPTKPEPGVFEFASTATGGAGTACAGMTFDVTVSDPATGKLLITPAAGNVTLAAPDPGPAGQCRIDLVFSVVGMPAGDSSGEGLSGKQTAQIASATQHDGSSASTDPGTSETTVNKATPAVATTPSPGVALGGTITATATVSGLVDHDPAATVTFTLFGPDAIPCQPPAAHTTSVPIGTDNTATSPPFAPPQVGAYRWIASFDGDESNATANSGCSDPVTVTPAPVPPPPPPPPPVTPTIAILASPGVVLGGGVSAVATLGGRANPASGATLLFRLYGPDDPGCGAQPLFAAAVAVNDGGVASSPQFTPPLQAGVYRWVASYAGDPANVAVATACNAPSSTVVVAPLPARVLSAGFVLPPRVGQISFLTVGAFDPLRPIAGLQVQFGEPRGLSGASACRLDGFGVASSPILLRLPYRFRVPGRHTVTIVVLSGDCRGELTRTTTTIAVDVAGSATARAAFAAAGEPAARAAQASACKNRFLRPGKAKSRAKVATAILCLVNAERRKQGLKSLKPSKALARASSGHSADMLRRRYFEHSGPGGPSLRTRLTKVRYRGVRAAENIGYGSNFNAKLIVQAWMNSPPHKGNILSPSSKFAGVGVAKGIPVSPGSPGSIYTMNFGSALK